MAFASKLDVERLIPISSTSQILFCLSFVVPSGTSIDISDAADSSPNISNIEDWFEVLNLASSLANAITLSRTSRIAERSPKESKAPHITRDSIDFLFTPPKSPFLHLSSKDSNEPFTFLDFKNCSSASEPTFFIAASPNLMQVVPDSSNSILKSTSLLFISGGKTFIPILLQSATAEISRSSLSI